MVQLIDTLNQIKPFIIDGEIRQLDKDSGDSAQRDGTFWAIIGIVYDEWSVFPADEIWDVLKITYDESMRNHQIIGGYYRRTCNKEHWGYAGNNFSRDQHSILRLAFAVMGDKKRLKESALAMLKRCLFHQNYKKGTDCTGIKCYKVPDLCHPNEVAVTIRGLGLWYLFPILLVTDLCFLADLVLRRGSADYDNMLMQQLAYAQKKYPTAVSKLAWRLYDKKDALTKIERYYSVTLGNGIAGFAQLFTLLVEHMDGPHQSTEVSS